eukprot:scaffold612037_cov19-Prasinocladus_malaysianus.AAC.1
MMLAFATAGRRGHRSPAIIYERAARRVESDKGPATKLRVLATLFNPMLNVKSLAYTLAP